MYDKSKVYAGTEEFQFEAIRAVKYMAILKQGLRLSKDVNRSKKEKNRVAQVEKKERVMYPKDRVCAYEGEFQLEEVMAKLYYERGNRLRMENKTTSSKVLIDSEVAHTATAAAHITIRNSAKKSHSLRNVEEFRVAEDDAEDFPPPRSRSQDTTEPNGNRCVPHLEMFEIFPFIMMQRTLPHLVVDL